MPIYDVRDYNAEAPPGIHTFGGFIGELMMSLQCLYDNLTAKGENPSFEMKPDSIMKFMEELLVDGYPAGICSLRVTGDPLTEPERNDEPVHKQANRAATRLSEGLKVAQYGTKFFFGVSPKCGFSKDIVQGVLQAICMIHYHEP